MKAKLFDTIKLKTSIPKERLSEGKEKLIPEEVGAIIEVFQEPNECYNAEFLYPNGYTKAICTISPDEFSIITPANIIKTYYKPTSKDKMQYFLRNIDRIDQ